MILARVEIDNYKQYRGHHELRIPTEAIIGVIGANGVGKTTLFEAIEWCLYSPSSITSRDIRPRGHGGLTKVLVALERTDGTGHFIVERELKRTSTTAIVLEVDESGVEQVIVQGPRQVSDYVATKLIGLSHVAFVATFFTRQKELHFFGNVGDTNRRREVGKLLGLETIRIAQQLIADDRKRTQSEADVLSRQYQELSSGRDFTAELTDASERLGQRTSEAVETACATAKLGETLATAEAGLRTLQVAKDQDTTLGQQIMRIEDELQAAAQRQATIADELDRLDAREAERAVLLPEAETLEALRLEISKLDQQRAMFSRKKELDVELEGLKRWRRDTLVSIRTTVATVRLVDAIPGWEWNDEDDAQPACAIDRLLAAVNGLDVSAVKARETALLRCRELGDDLERANETLHRYKIKRQTYDEQRQGILEAGDPSVEISELERGQEAIRQQIATLEARRTTLESKRDQSRQLIANLDRADFGDRCPTCARPFSESDAALVAETLRAQITTISEDLQSALDETSSLRQRTEYLAARRSELGQQIKRLVEVENSIRSSVSYLRDQEEVVERHREALDKGLRDAGVRSIPAPETLKKANSLVDQYRQLIGSRERLTAGRKQLADIDMHRNQAATEHRELAGVSFDEELHRQTVVRHQRASRAQTTIEQIDQDLGRRPRLLHDRDMNQSRIFEHTTRRHVLQKERSALGFDGQELESATDSVELARKNERAAIQVNHAAQTAVRDAEHQQSVVKADQERIRNLAESADARRRDHDLLDQMYREFTEFERYAAGRLTPILGDLTSDLVREITDGKYDRVEFDSNFGIQVFDGEEERFPLEGFSGGERDAISLSARLALSRLIAGQATNPPGFLVLDEVFGSLDRDRRTRLLELFGTLSRTFDDFRQLFIISHVDDVRTSAIFDEIWRIEETADGSSKLHVLTAGEEIGEL